MSRPTKYNSKLVEKARNYLDDYQQYEHVIPSTAGLAVVLGVSRETLYAWGREKTEFSDILCNIQAKQESVLINNGLQGTFNSAITKLVLGKHGYHEKQDQHLSGANGGPVESKWTVEFVNASEDG